MKLDEILQEQFVVIGNPGKSQPSSLYPSTEEPKLYSKAEAEKLATKLNDSSSKITFGAQPSSVHWHCKPVKTALDYVVGSKAHNAIRDLMK